MSRSETFIGFDSAWTDNVRNPRAITALTFRGDGTMVFEGPRLATFSQAGDLVEEHAEGSDYVLVGVDQPTIVPNQTGSRPVERVAGGLVGKLGGGVQPANRGKAMFGDGAPIWRFLERLGAIQNPFGARSAKSGRFVIEVFPALSVPAIVPAIWQRSRAAKYNPGARRFQAADWSLVAFGVAAYAADLGLFPVATWAREVGSLVRPRKADQDKLDAVICLLVAVGWRRAPADRFIQLGDDKFGYIVAAVSPPTRALLTAKAALVGVPVDAPWG